MEEVKPDEFDKKMGKNKEEKSNAFTWKISTGVFALLTAVLLIMLLTKGMTGNVVSESSALSSVADIVKNSYGVELLPVSSEVSGDVYSLTYTLDGKELIIESTKTLDFLRLPSGEWVRVQDLLTAAEQLKNQNQTTQTNTQPKDVPKTAKPKVEAFIFSYCPYGLQFEKALFPVYDLLKNKADINIVAIGAMHGEFEKIESLRQISIEKLYNKDKLFAYLKEFDNNVDIGSCNGNDACLEKYLPAIYSKLGIDKTKVEAYMKTSAETIYNEQGTHAASLGVSGSPTFVINGAEVQVGRTSDAIKTAVCSAFTTIPSECSQALSSQSTSPGFGSSTTASSSAASCG